MVYDLVRIGPLEQPVSSVLVGRNYSEGEYVRGRVHTQNMESFWSLIKRGIIGNFHQVSEAYLPLYVSEFEFRHNMRGEADPFGTLIANC